MKTVRQHTRLELASIDRTYLAVHQEINEAIDTYKPAHLHKWQWCEAVILAGLEALKTESGDIAA